MLIQYKTRHRNFTFMPHTWRQWPTFLHCIVSARYEDYIKKKNRQNYNSVSNSSDIDWHFGSSEFATRPICYLNEPRRSPLLKVELTALLLGSLYAHGVSASGLHNLLSIPPLLVIKWPFGEISKTKDCFPCDLKPTDPQSSHSCLLIVRSKFVRLLQLQLSMRNVKTLRIVIKPKLFSTSKWPIASNIPQVCVVCLICLEI